MRIAVGLTLVAFVAGCTTPLHASSSGSDAALDSLLAGAVGEKDYLGAVAMVSLKDVIVYHGALGHADATGSSSRNLPSSTSINAATEVMGLVME